MKKIIWEQSYEINSFLANPQRKLGLYALLNLLQDAAWLHATNLGHGFEEALEKKMFWALTRQKVIMKEWPKWGESVLVRTWIRPLRGPFADRDFEVVHQDKIIGTATTSWLMMDLDSRRPYRGSLTEEQSESRSDYALPYSAAKVGMRPDLMDQVRFQVRNGDLDVNQHMNNTRYAQWVLDAIPLEWHREFRLEEYEVNFLAESHSGDTITIQMSPETEFEPSGGWMQFQGQRTEDKKVVFTARLKASKNQ